jgi:hypothetical protein
LRDQADAVPPVTARTQRRCREDGRICPQECHGHRIRWVTNASDFTDRQRGSPRVPSHPRLAPIIGHDVHQRPGEIPDFHSASPPAPTRPARHGVAGRESGGKVERNSPTARPDSRSVQRPRRLRFLDRLDHRLPEPIALVALENSAFEWSSVAGTRAPTPPMRGNSSGTHRDRHRHSRSAGLLGSADGVLGGLHHQGIAQGPPSSAGKPVSESRVPCTGVDGNVGVRVGGPTGPLAYWSSPRRWRCKGPCRTLVHQATERHPGHRPTARTGFAASGQGHARAPQGLVRDTAGGRTGHNQPRPVKPQQ